ncbi:hypothetical protein EJ03DRAFT_374501 [Teratosphaeria nubilosa]|uniref:Uncharacterized protein n=1 Tax=Teratosphaeria nubilosa TaxID=161662 RepID=A0A6G1L915_9PEZI|nr:hypothetical protein EJ03DRAFT_374501 [Teratosphaeria nubilosa]
MRQNMRGSKRLDDQPQVEDTPTKGTPKRLVDVKSDTSPPSKRGRSDKVELDAVDADYVSSLLLEAQNELPSEQEGRKSQHAVKSAIAYIKSADQLATRHAERLEKQRQEIKTWKKQVSDGDKERRALRKQTDALRSEASKLIKANAQLRQTLQTRDAELQYLQKMAREDEKKVLEDKGKMLERELNKARAEGGKVVVELLSDGE